MNKISVIVPVYNAEKFIEDTLNSIVNQTYANLEIIAVDDGSTDKSSYILDEFAKKDSRIIVIHKENSGVSATRNKGLDVATGDYITFVDSDDKIEPDMYERLINNAIKYNADISHCGYTLITPNGKETPIHGSNLLKEQDNFTGFKDIMEGTLVEPGVWNKLIKYDIIQDIRFNEAIKYNEDIHFAVYAFLKSKKSIFEDFPGYIYYLRAGSATTDVKGYDPHRDILWVYEDILNKVSDNEYMTKVTQKRLIDKYIYAYFDYAFYDNNKANNVKNKLTKLVREVHCSNRVSKLYYFIIKLPLPLFKITYKILMLVKPDRRTHKI